MNDDTSAFLLMLYNRKKQFKGRSTQKEIFLGCYDVWHGKQDMIDSQKIPGMRLNYFKGLGLIINESGNKDWKYSENWSLTEAGEKYLFEAYPDLLNNNI